MEYRCKVCDKAYTSYQSLWNHNRNIHTPEVIQILHKIPHFKIIKL